CVDGAFRANDRRGKEIRRVEHPGSRRLERGTDPWRSGGSRSTAQAGARQRPFRGRGEARAVVDGAGIDRRVRVHRASATGGSWTDVVRGAVEPCRLEAGEPAGARLGDDGIAISNGAIAVVTEITETRVPLQRTTDVGLPGARPGSWSLLLPWHSSWRSPGGWPAGLLP